MKETPDALLDSEPPDTFDKIEIKNIEQSYNTSKIQYEEQSEHQTSGEVHILLDEEEVQNERENQLRTSENSDKISNYKTPVPWKAAIILLLVTIAEGMSFSVYYAFSAKMMETQFGVPNEEVGYYVGFLATGYYVGQLISNYPVGWISDKIGRRPLLLLGLVSNALCQICFGLSFSLWFAIFIRFVNGTLNSNIPIVKCYVREITDETNQAKVYSVRTIGYALGSVLGPFIGGFFARPAESSVLSIIPLFTMSFFTTFPYFLSCFVSACINFTSFTLSYIFLKESLKKKKQTPAKSDPSNIEIELAKFEDNNTIISVDIDNNQEITPESTDTGTSENMNTDNQSLLVEKSVLVNTLDSIHTNEDKIENEKKEESKTCKLKSLLYKLPLPWEIFTKGVVSTCVIYIVNASCMTVIAQTNPVWLSRDNDYQGLDFDEGQIGITNSFAGICSFVFQLLLFSKIDKWIGQTNSYRVAMLVFVPAIMLMPFTSHLIDNKNVFMWLALLLCIGTYGITVSWSFGSINLLINNAAPSNYVGRVNGFASTATASARIFAPIFGTSLFAWSANLNHFYPLNYTLVFNISAILALLSVALTFLVPRALNRSRTKK